MFSSNHRVLHGNERKLWFNTVLNQMSEADHLTIFMCGYKSNWSQEGNLQPAVCGGCLRQWP